jgi:hypothetical protein
MSWEADLFAVIDDLEQEAAAAFAVERDAEVADRARSAYAEVTLVSRLMASLDRETAVRVRGVGPVHGRLQRVGPDWCLLRAGRRDWVVPAAAITTVRGASDRALPEVAWSPVCRLGLGAALRRIAGTRQPCLVHHVDGDSEELVLTRVGADFVEGTTVDGAVVLVPLSTLAAVQSSADDDAG